MLRILSEIRYAPCALSRHVCGQTGSVCQSPVSEPLRRDSTDAAQWRWPSADQPAPQVPRDAMAPRCHTPCQPKATQWHVVLSCDQCFIFYFIFSQNGPQLVCSIKCCNLTQSIDTKRPHHSHQNDFGKMFLCSSNTQDGYRACINSLQYIEGAYWPIYLIIFPIYRLI